MTNSEALPWQYEFEAIGTHWVIDILAKYSESLNKNLLSDIQNRIALFDQTYSRFRSDSLVVQISKSAGVYNFPDDAAELFTAYQKFYDLTNGAVTPLIGNTMEQAGYDSQYSLKPKELTSLPKWDEVLLFNNGKLTVNQPHMLDFGAAGKGYLVDIIGDLVLSHGLNSFCIDAGGDILQKNTRGEFLKVGLEHPNNPDEIIGVAQIANQSLCGSAGNRKKWEGFHHIINPHDLKSPENIIAVWTVADKALYADGLATCLFFADPEKLKSHFEFEYLIIYKDMTFNCSAGFPAEIYLK